ncbi:MAG: sulfatase-like hydrolase/transferase [Bryobacterales bacterium]|nr:sulfatase-like hydrolase/transferase [Bryobacterales bacterium]
MTMDTHPTSASRRRFLSLGAASALACARLAAQTSQRIEAGPPAFVDRKRGIHPFRQLGTGTRPHIFLISADMMSPDHWLPGRSVGQQMDLPAMRSLFADSTFFTNAFTTSPLCAPARAALLTGRHTYLLANNERAHDGFEISLRAGDVIFPEYLKAAGYKTKHCGKGHLGAQKYFDAFDENADGWDRWDPPILVDEGYVDHLRRLRVRPQRYAREIFGLQQDRASHGNSLGGWIEQDNGEPFPLEAQYSHYLAHRAISKLDSALQGASGSSPVYLQLDFFDPHQPFSIPEGFQKREAELRRALRLPGSYAAVRARDWAPSPDEPLVYDRYRRYWGLYQAKTVEDYRVAHALQLEIVDRALGRFLDALKQRGLYDDSLIVFTSDHGEMNGRRAMVDKGVYLHPEVLRVPLAVKMPKSAGIKPGVVDHAVSHLDIAPTVLSEVGVQPEERLDGQPLQPLLRDAADAGRKWLFECGWHVGANFACGMQGRMQNGDRYLYSYNIASTVDELYDLRDEDPVNLAKSPDHQPIRKQMVGQLGAFLEKDPRWLAWWSSYRIDHYHTMGRPQGDMQLKGAK